MKKQFVKLIAIICSVAMVSGNLSYLPPITAEAASHTYAEDSNVFLDAGGYKTEPYGTVTSDYMNTYKQRADVLPKLSDVYLTDNYKSKVATVPTSDWASSVVFDQFSESLYVHPMAFRATSAGMEMATPAVVDTTFPTDNEPAVESLLEDSSVELVMGGEGFTAKDAQIDAATDWTYDILMENASGNASILTTLAKGSPYVYYQFDNVTPTISLGGGATNMVIYKNSASSNSIGISVLNTTDNTTHYYGVYASSGATWTNGSNKLTANLPAGKEWITIATLPDNSDETFALYESYAANRISNTLVEWEYNENESKVYTTYNITTTNLDTGVTGGNTIIALYPHQWRYAVDVAYTGKEYETIRGTMKTTIGNEYVTEMVYNGILTAMPTPASEEGLGTLKNQISYFWDYYENTMKGTYTEAGDWQYGGYDTYWMGKNFNKRADIIFMAEQIEDDSEDWAGIKNDILTALAEDLQYWFNPADCYTTDVNPYITGFFYYYDDFGTLIGYNSSYSSDSELNDHHFHYGYWIKAAAAVAMHVEDWEKEWGAIIYEMISDMANPNRDGTNLNVQRTDVDINSTTNYPFLRNFDIYEGHSWASGVANYEFDKDGNMVDPGGGLSGGNNQESTSEAVNAWSSLILWGEAVGDDRIRDLGVYLYTTEVASIEEYYFDMHNEVFTEAYKDSGAEGYNQNVVTRLFGGRYDHSAWWTEDPIEVTSIHMIPMTGSTLYFSKYPDKIKDTYDSIWGKQWSNYINLHTQNGWQTLTSTHTHHDLLAEFYAMADPSAAMGKWSIGDVDGKTVIEAGESRAHTYGYIQSMIEYGTPNFEVTGSHVYSMVFEKEDGTRTYVAQNYGNEPLDVYFSDGTYITVPAGSAYAGAKTGDGENPNLRAKVSYTVETYLENITENGYDMQSVTKRASAGEITYAPEEIAGFTFDEAAENVLTGTLVEGQDNTVILKVYYNRNHYSIQYEMNEGDNHASNPSEYLYGTAVTLQVPTRTGYRFLGWYEDMEFATPFSGITESTTGNKTVYAKWISESSATYTVNTYFQNPARTGYQLVETDVMTGEIGDLVNVTYDGDTTGFTLNNENTVASGQVAAGDSLVLSIYYDRNVYSITYNNMTDAVLTYGSPETYVYGVGATLLAPTKEGYTFGGWFSDEACSEGNMVAQISTTDIGDIVVYAKWTEKQEETEGGVNTNPGTDNGINYDAASGTATFYYNGVTTGIVYAAVYDDLVTAQNIVAEANANKPGFTYVTGHQGYPLVANGSDSKYELAVTEGKYIVYAFNPGYSGVLDWYIYQAGGVVTASYTVNHLKQNVALNGYDVAEQNVVSNQTVGTSVSAMANHYDGFTFDEENSVTSGSVESDSGLVLNLYYNRNKYNITYHLDGGINAETNQEQYVYGVGLTLADPTREGYTFDGWYTQSLFSESSKITAIGTEQTGDITLYAKWTSTQEGNEGYTVKYYQQNVALDGYTEVESDRVNGTAGVGELVNATILTYTGFSQNVTMGAVSGTVKAGETLELSVYYDRNKYDIVYHLDGGTNAESNVAQYVYGVGLTLADPTKEDYTFNGWYVDSAFSESAKVTAIGTEQTGTITLYAKWTQNASGGNEGGNQGGSGGNEGGNEGTGDGGNQGGNGGNEGTGDGGDQGGNGGNEGTGDGSDQGGTGGNQGTGDGNDQGGSGSDDPGWSVDVVKDRYYTGKKITPTIVVEYDGKKLQKGKDYTIKYQNNVNAGTATIVVTGKGNYTGTKLINFEILPIELEDNEEITADDIYKFVNGKDINMNPVVKWGKKKLKINKDFIIDTTIEGSQLTYKDEGRYELVLKGIGNYTGTITIDVVLADKKSTVLISKAKIAKIAAIPYEGEGEYCPELTVTYKGTKLIEGTHYEVAYKNNTNAGTAQAIVKGIMLDDNLKFTGTKVVKFTIKGEKLTSKGVVLGQSSYEYTGENIEPEVTVVDKSGEVVGETDYVVSYTNNLDKGTGKVTVTGINGYEGKITKSFKIRALDVNSDVVDKFMEETTVSYAKGGAKAPVTVMYDGDVLTENVDYTLKYSENKDLGTAYVTILGKGNFGGKTVLDYEIEECDLENVLMTVSDVVYNNSKNMRYYLSKISLTDVDGKKLTAGKDYMRELVYEIQTDGGEWDVISENSDVSRISVGSVLRVTATGMGNYLAGSVNTVEYRVIPADKSIKAATVTILPQTYTGEAITLEKKDIVSVKVKVNGTWITLEPESYEIVEGSYKNNIKKGKASVMIRGVSEYGGYKTATFRIESKDIEDVSYFSRLIRWLQSILQED